MSTMAIHHDVLHHAAQHSETAAPPRTALRLVVAPNTSLPTGQQAHWPTPGQLTLDLDGVPPQVSSEPGRLPELPPGTPIRVRQLTTVAVETLYGLRHPQQIARYCHPQVWSLIQRKAALAVTFQRAIKPPQVRTLVLSCPTDGICEAAAVIHDQHRFRAIAMRWEWRKERWQLRALELG